MTNNWVVSTKGNPDTESWEIAVVRESNTHGLRSYGWFGEDKLLVSHNGGPCRWPLAPGLGKKMLKLAEELAEELNAAELAYGEKQ